MQILIRFSLWFVLSCFIAVSLTFAQGVDAPAGAEVPPFEWWTYIIPLLTPLLVLGVKKLAPNIPNAWLPVIATMSGVVLDFLHGLATTATSHVGLGVVLGLASIGVRELLDQLKQAAAGEGGTPAKSAIYESAVDSKGRKAVETAIAKA